jgi:dTDP-4-amino-4,6-dideoxygalactose transaminase
MTKIQHSGIKGKKHVYSFNYTRSALDFLFQNMHLPNQRVVFPAFICPIVVEVAVRNGIEPVLVDVNLSDMHLNLDEVKKLNLSTIDAVFLNHTFGVPAEVGELKEILKGTTVKIIEDLAHGWFTEGVGQGDFQLMSLYKQVANNGGGLLVSKTSFDEPYDQVPESKHSLGLSLMMHVVPGFILGAIRKRKGLYHASDMADEKWSVQRANLKTVERFNAQFKTLEKEVKRRRQLFRQYDAAMDEDYWVPQIGPLSRASFSMLSFRLKKNVAIHRDSLLGSLRKKGIFLDRMWYNAPAVLSKYQKYLHGKCPNAKQLAESVINLPLTPDSTIHDIPRIMTALHEELMTRV